MTNNDPEAVSSKPQSPAPSPRPFSVWLATGLGICLFVRAPGTVGTALFGLPLAWAVAHLPGVGWQLLVIAVVVIAGIPLTTAANWALGVEKDHQAIVWDEIASMPIVFLVVPLTNWKIAIMGFALHRLFDITKPPPARQLERLPEGLGVMADDLMAAIYACGALGVIAWLDDLAAWRLLAAIRG